MLVIRKECPEDYYTVENLTREAFWNVYRPGCEEHYILHAFRNMEDFISELSLLMEVDGTVIGHIMYAKANILASDSSIVPVVTFGPVSILPRFQHKGYGKLLVDYSMIVASSLGFGAVCIEGDFSFYGKCGFIRGISKGISNGGDAQYFLLKELKCDYLKGISGKFITPKGYFVSDDDVDNFDLQFPKKRKQWLPSQLF